MASIFSYVVRYDSGFAPNPFYGVCSLATCKPPIRRVASIGDWLVGCGSNAAGLRRGGYLVYAMRVSDVVSFDTYSIDPRYAKKQPYRFGSRKQSCGDNIYFRTAAGGEWHQRDSFHARADGSADPRHIRRDTSVNRVLLSDHFYYFGGEGHAIPSRLRDANGRGLAKSGVGFNRYDDDGLIARLEEWLSAFDPGYQGAPTEWLHLRRR